MSLSEVLRQDIAPVVTAFLGLLVLFVWYATRRGRVVAKQEPALGPITGPIDWRKLARRLAGTMIGGYVIFALIIGIFYFVLGEQAGNFVQQSLAQAAILEFGIVLPAFVLLTWVESGWRRRHLRRDERQTEQG
jgi:Family of unknown function (DUF6256)